ncbi:SDR family NAD(P)-dependent oxidoreductase [Microbacterium sp. USHLN186]|uniref:SDR family NAD(P)-dependent oxidoreductase n=1 Tax=Microbacterium sp. USHLN186 TaxID=3081286 RepID=UPI00301703CB
MLFENKSALVTAAGAGIGRAIAVKLAAEGARVVVSDVDDTAGAETVELIVGAGGTAVYQHANVADDAEVRALVQRAVDEHGGLDLAVNNAGLGAPPRPLQQISDAEWQRTIAVTLTGTFHCMRAELERMTAQGAGAIVNIASIAGLQSTSQLTPYGAAKHGVVSLTMSAAAENAAAGIRINAVAPGPVLTAALASLPAESRQRYADEVPMRRLGDPEDIAEATAFLLSDAAGFITGVTLPVDGGSLAR